MRPIRWCSAGFSMPCSLAANSARSERFWPGRPGCWTPSPPAVPPSGAGARSSRSVCCRRTRHAPCWLDRSWTPAWRSVPTRSPNSPRAADDYPYFLQLYGAAAWDAVNATGAGGIRPEHVTAAIDATSIPRRKYCRERYEEFRKANALPLARDVALAFSQADRPVTDAKLNQLLARYAGDPAENALDAERQGIRLAGRRGPLDPGYSEPDGVHDRSDGAGTSIGSGVGRIRPHPHGAHRLPGCAGWIR